MNRKHLRAISWLIAMGLPHQAIIGTTTLDIIYSGIHYRRLAFALATVGLIGLILSLLLLPSLYIVLASWLIYGVSLLFNRRASKFFRKGVDQVVAVQSIKINND